MCSSQFILNNYTNDVRNRILFMSGFRSAPITIDKFINLFYCESHPDNEVHLMFVCPERFRFHYMVTYIHNNRTHFY